MESNLILDLGSAEKLNIPLNKDKSNPTWTIDYKFLNELSKEHSLIEAYGIALEDVEAVLIDFLVWHKKHIHQPAANK